MENKITKFGRRTIRLAEIDTLKMGGDTVKPENLFRGIIMPNFETVAQQCLSLCGINIDGIWDRDYSVKSVEINNISRIVSYDEYSIECLQQALIEANRFGDIYIGSEHILLSLLKNKYEINHLCSSSINYDSIAISLESINSG